MKRSVMRKWVKALRSGDYKQTQGTLKDEFANDDNGNDYVGHCCLGVLCEVKAKEQKKSYKKIAQLHDGSLPDNVMKWSGISESTGFIKGKMNTLADLNDTKKWSFKKIAKYIEKNYKAL